MRGRRTAGEVKEERGKEDGGREGLERIRRVCKRRAARGGCTAPTFRGEAGDPIAMHHPVLPTTIRYSCTYATLSQLHFSLSLSFFFFPSHRRALSLPTRSFSFRSPRFSPFGEDSAFSRLFLSFISSASATTSLSTIRALVFPRHNSTAAVVALFQHFTTHRRDFALYVSRNTTPLPHLQFVL